MLTDLERQERAPESLQRALLEIEQEIADLGPQLIEAKMEATRCEFALRILKERKSALQSTLKSLF